VIDRIRFAIKHTERESQRLAEDSAFKRKWQILLAKRARLKTQK
jgi:hypothetical protein